MRFPIIRSGNDNTPIAWWEWLFAPFVYGLLLIFFVLAALFSIPIGIIIVVLQWFQERRFLRKMRERGRFIAWEELEPRLQAGDGTLVVEAAPKEGIRVWWTQDDIVHQAPTQPPLKEELDYMRCNAPHPFVSWCYGRFLDPDYGQAFLTEPRFLYHPGIDVETFFSEMYPKLRVVMTVKLR